MQHDGIQREEGDEEEVLEVMLKATPEELENLEEFRNIVGRLNSMCEIRVLSK